MPLFPASVSWEMAVLVLCALLLLPRVVGVGVNWLIHRLLRSLPDINVSIAGLSLRRVTEIRLDLLSLPLGPFLTARALITVDELAWTPRFTKPLWLTVRGAKIHLMLRDTPSPSPHSSPSPAPPPRTVAPHSSPPRPAAAAGAEPNIPELFAGLSNMAGSSSTRPVQRGWQWTCMQLRGWFFHSVAVSLSSVLVLVSKDDSVVSARLASLLLYIEHAKSTKHILRQLHCKLGGIELRLGRQHDSDIAAYPTTESVFTASFQTRQTPSSEAQFMGLLNAGMPSTAAPSLRQMVVPPTARPPLLVLHPLMVLVEFPLNMWVPSGVTRVELKAQGLSVYLDPVLNIPRISVALRAYQRVIMRVQAAAAAEAAAPPRPPSPKPRGPAAMAASYATASLEAAKRRDSVLRFLPSNVSVTMHRVNLALFEREANSLDSLITSLSSDVYSDVIARYGMGKHKDAPSDAPPTTSTAVPVPAQFIAPASSTTSGPPVVISPILHHVELTLTIVLFQSSFKTHYPVPTHFTPVRSTYDNHLSSFDVSCTIGRGIVLYMSQQPERPLLNVASVKFDWKVSPTSSSFGNSPFAFGQTASSDLGLFSVEGEGEGTKSGAKGGCKGEEEGSLFHPVSVRNARNHHSVSLIFVQTTVALHHRLGHWIQFGMSVASTCSVLIALVPVIGDELRREQERKNKEASRRRARLEEERKQQEARLAAYSSSTSTSARRGMTDWKDNRRWERPDALVLKFSLPNAPHDRKSAAVETAERGIQNHVVFAVKAISGVHVILCSLQDSDPHAYVQLGIDEVTVRMEREPYTHSQHSMHDMLNASSDEFASLFSRTIIPYNSHRASRINAPAKAKDAAAAPSAPSPASPTSSSPSPSSSSSSSSFSSSSSSSLSPSTAPREKVQIVLTSLHVVLPHEAHSRTALPPHSLENIKQPGRFVSLSSASVTIDRGSPDIVLAADGLAIKYSPAVLDVFPNVFHFILAIMPTLPLRMDADGKEAKAEPPPPPPMPSLNKSDYPVPLLNLKGSVSNVTVDFPTVLEFRTEDSDTLRMAEIITDDAVVPPPAKPHAAGEEKTDPSTASYPQASATARTGRPPTLFTYAGSLLAIDVHLPTSAWALHLKHSYCLHEDIPFLSIKHANLAGRNATATVTKGLDVTADGVEGEWTAACFLPLFKLIKSVASNTSLLFACLLRCGVRSLTSLSHSVVCAQGHRCRCRQYEAAADGR